MNELKKLTDAVSLAICALLAVAMSACTAGSPPLVWKLQDISRVGDYATSVSGSPRVVSEGGESAICFDGASDAIFVAHNPIAEWREFTIEALIKPDARGHEEQRFLHIQDERDSRLLLETRLTDRGEWTLDTFLFVSPEVRLTLLDREQVHPAEQWHWVALTFDGETMIHYVNGKKELEGKIAFQPMTSGRTSIGVRQNKVSWYKGCIREVRFTPSALAAESLQQ